MSGLPLRPQRLRSARDDIAEALAASAAAPEFVPDGALAELAANVRAAEAARDTALATLAPLLMSDPQFAAADDAADDALAEFMDACDALAEAPAASIRGAAIKAAIFARAANLPGHHLTDWEIAIGASAAADLARLYPGDAA